MQDRRLAPEYFFGTLDLLCSGKTQGMQPN